LTSYLFRAYKVETNHITLELDFDETYLNLDKAVPCGLIISELVSNSLKYAFPNQNKGIIRISVNCDEGGDIQLIVRDNGIGFPINWDFNSINSLGLQLVNVLINQIEGTLELNHSQGVQFEISFRNQ
jgi:two-component sensor histidine kinase